jgi:hypothetical protein
LLFDEQLSEELCRLLQDIFPDSLHVKHIGDGGFTDAAVWQLAQNRDCLLVTKDEDVHRLSVRLEPTLFHSREHDGLEVGVDGLQGDLGVVPRVAVRGLLALVALDRVALAGLGVGGVAQLDEYGLALACALDVRHEEAVRAGRDGGLHRLAHDLGDEHAGVQAVARFDRDPSKLSSSTCCGSLNAPAAAFSGTSGTQVA